jgi:hypothetical protein
MTVEKVEKLVDAQFVLNPRKVTKTIFVTSDGTEFDAITIARKYDKKDSLIKEFKKQFSEEKGNFKIGVEELNKELWIEETGGSDFYYDSFWVKIKNIKEEQYFQKFCKELYKLPYQNLYDRKNISCIGWKYIMVITNGKYNRVYWISKEQLEKGINIVKNNFPENIKNSYIKKKKTTRAELIDI